MSFVKPIIKFRDPTSIGVPCSVAGEERGPQTDLERAGLSPGAWRIWDWLNGYILIWYIQEGYSVHAGPSGSGLLRTGEARTPTVAQAMRLDISAVLVCICRGHPEDLLVLSMLEGQEVGFECQQRTAAAQMHSPTRGHHRQAECNGFLDRCGNLATVPAHRWWTRTAGAN